jgi:putative copper export protein/methionine-rich copper-binding protein CopC
MRRALGAFLLASSLVLAIPSASLAHAGVVSSDPEPGAKLGSAPGVVVLRFSEPINEELSRARVVASDGTLFTGSVSASQRIDVPLTTNASGIYDVEWTTVSRVDGHTLHGSFQFGVGVRPGSGKEGIVEDEPGLPELAVGVGRAIEDVALFMATGALLLNTLSRRRPTLDWVRLRPARSLVVAAVAGLAVVIGEALLAAPSPSWGAIWTYLTSGPAGIVRLLRPIVEAASVLASLVSVGFAVPFLAASFVLLAASGHAAAVEPAALGTGIETVHLWSAACWAGGILALSRLHPRGGLLRGDGRPLLEQFTPVALVTFGVTAVTGSLRAVQELGRLGALFTSLYGWTLLAKVLAIVLMVELSFLAWRRIAAWPRAEASFAVIAIGAAALLASFPLPPSRAELTEEEQGAEGLAGLPSATALTLGGHAGPVLVGLSVDPGVPGPNAITLFILPLEGESAAAHIPAEIYIDGERVALTQCGGTCREAKADLAGGERIAVHIPGDEGGTATFELPDLPAPGAGDLADRMMTRMHALRTYRLEETLSSGGPSVVSRYAFQRPDRAESSTETSEGTTHVVWVGTTQYLRTPGNDWSVSKGGPGQEVPSFIWDYFQPFRDVREVGKERVDGVTTSVMAFFGGSETTPVWFKLWIDGGGLVRRAEMRAQGHFMDHRYFAFNEPVTIEPPKGAEG